MDIIALKHPGRNVIVWSQHNRLHVVERIVCQQFLYKSTLHLTESVKEEVLSVAVRKAVIAICLVIKLQLYNSTVKQ